MDFKKAFTYMFLDKELPKVAFIWIVFYLFTQLLGSIDDILKIDAVKEYLKTVVYNDSSVFGIVVIAFIALCIIVLFSSIMQTGFSALLIKNSTLSVEKVLPGWGRNFKEIFSFGARTTIGVILLLLAFVALFAILPIATFFVNSTLFLIVTVVEIIACIPIILFLIVMSNAIFINFIHKNSLWAMFDFKSIFQIVKADFSNYFLLLIANLGIGLGGTIIVFIFAFILFVFIAIIYAICSIFMPVYAVVSIVAILSIIVLFACGFGIFYVTLVTTNLVGQYYKMYLDILSKENL